MELFVCVMVFAFIMMVKNGITYNIRITAISKDYAAYKNGPSYEAMLFNPFKWTYKQFYGTKK